MSQQRIQITGFAPDLPPDTQGYFFRSNAIIPTARGFSAGPSPGKTNIAVAAGSTASLGAFQTKTTAGVATYYMGTAAKLYQITANGATITDKSGATYNATVSIDGLWSWSQFGSITLAVNKFDTLQAATTGSSSFAAVSGAPKAAIVVTCGGPTSPFAMVFNYNNGTDTPDGIYWSALADYTNWTPSTATQCGFVRMYDPVGPFIAAIRFRDGVLAWKEDSMFLGTYVGGATVWQWQKIASDCGCAGKNLVCAAGDKVYFADKRGLWVYDGSYPSKIPGYTQDYWAQYFYPNTAGVNSNSTQMLYDATRHNLWVCAESVYLVYNLLAGTWTYHGFLSDLAMATQALSIIGFTPTPLAIYTASGPIQYVDTFTYGGAKGTTGEVEMMLTYLGDPIQQTMVRRIAPVWLVTDSNAQAPDANSACEITAFASMPADVHRNVGDTTGSTKSMTPTIDAKMRYFDASVTGNYLRIAMINWNNAEFRDVVIDAQTAGAA